MKTWIVGVVVGLAAWQVAVAESDWLTDLPKAKGKAKAEQRLVVMNFTGSDWCGWCKKFSADVLTKPEFTEYAGKNLVLVEVDFPRSKKMDDALKSANKALQDQYKVQGFPTFVVLNSDGKEVARQVGYLEGGPKAFIAKLEEARQKH
jgi:protein disulfide-isomerase